jgi:hypothetical protein
MSNGLHDPMKPVADCPKAGNYTPKALDNLIGAKVILPQGDIIVHSVIIGRKCDSLGSPFGLANTNPILDTHPVS